MFCIIVTGVFANGNSAKKTKTVRVLNVDVKISIEQAKQLALNHSKVSKNMAKMTKIRLDKKIENLFMKQNSIQNGKNTNITLMQTQEKF